LSNFKLGYATIPQAATATANLTASTTRPIANLHSGSRSDRFELASSSTDTLTVNYDLGASTTKTANFIALMRAKLLHRNDCTGIRLRGSTQSATLPSTLTPTAWFDPNRGVTTSSGAVSQWNDLSGNNYHATQGTAANRPLLSRADTNENLVLYSESFANAYWAKGNTTLVASGETDPFGGTASFLFYPTTTGSSRSVYANEISTKVHKPVIGVEYETKFTVKAAGMSWCLVYNNSGSKLAWFNLSTGAKGTVEVGVIADIVSLGNGWYDVSVRFTATSTLFYCYLGICDADSTHTATTSSTNGILVYRAQFRSAASSSTYIATTTYPQYAGINGNRALVFDGTNDYLSANSVASIVTGTDKAFTMITVVKSFLTTSSAQFATFGSTASLTPLIWNGQTFSANSKISYERRDDAGLDKSTTSSDTALSSITIISTVSSGTAVNIYANGSNVISAFNEDVAAMTLNMFTIGAAGRMTTFAQNWSGYICEQIIFNSALSVSDRQAIEAYLTTKYITTPILQLDNLSTTTLMGPNAEDYFSVFTESAAFRHWWLEFVNTGTASIYPCSKVLFGKALDFGREPSAPVQLDLSRINAWSREAQHRVNLKVEAVTDTLKETFLNEIAKYADVMPVVVLDPAAAFSRSTKGFHSYLADNTIEIPNVAENDINMTFVEQI